MILVFYSTFGFAEKKQTTFFHRPLYRLGRGVVNTLTSPFEIPNQIYVSAKYQEERSGNPFAIAGGYLAGIPIGFVYTIWRAAAGMYDIFTFPFNRLDKEIIHPEYITPSPKGLDY